MSGGRRRRTDAEPTSNCLTTAAARAVSVPSLLMSSKSISLLALAASSAAAWAAPPPAGAKAAAVTEGLMCALGATPEGYVPLLDMPASAAAAKDVRRLVSALCPQGCGQVGVFRNPTSPNAMTVSAGGRMSKIAYRAAFVDGAVHSYGGGAALGIFAHEVGHHMDANAPATDWMEPRWGSELRADAWAACALAKAGSKGNEVKAALQALAAYPSSSHPVWSERAAALQKGYRSCGGAALAELDPRAGQSGAVGASEGAAAKSARPPRGCAVDRECKIGRVCLDGRCQDGSLRRACTRDVDCPGTQICAAGGLCQAPGDSGAAPIETSAAGRVASAATDPSSGCHDRCGDDEGTCSGRTDHALRECKRALIADPRYAACTCPRWPAGRLDCYQFCRDTYEKAKACETAHENDGAACVAVAARCASDCR